MGDPHTSDALLLRAVDYRDADRIVTLFTQDLGKVSAIARGARGSKRRFAGALEPYAVVRVELQAARGELMQLRRAEVQRSFPSILSDLDRMQAAAAALLLLRELHAARVPDPRLFVAAVQYLTLVDLAGDVSRAGLLAFAVRALALSGTSPRFDACGRSGESVPSGRAGYFDPDLGAVVARRYGGGPFLLSGASRERLMLAQSDAWVRAARETWEQDALYTARAAVAAFLAAHFSAEVGSALFPR